jgi:GLPGLI family protein
MKKIIMTAATAMWAVFAFGQDEGTHEAGSGRIIFEEKIKLEISFEGDAALADMLPKERKSEKELLFSDGFTLFRESRSTDEDMTLEHSEGVSIRMVGSGQNIVFTDVANRKVTEKRDFMNRIFIVERDLPVRKWKITANNKNLLGYNCLEALSTDTAGMVTRVWFSPEFGAQGGPAMFGDLPGMVLEADINDGRRTFLAKAVEPLLKEEKLEKPTDGKRVTEEEYEAIVAEKLKEMGIEEGNAGGGGHMRIVIRK